MLEYYYWLDGSCDFSHTKFRHKKRRLYTSVFVTSKPFSLSLQPLTAFAELRYGRRDFAKIESRKTEKRKVGRVAEGEVGG